MSQATSQHHKQSSGPPSIRAEQYLREEEATQRRNESEEPRAKMTQDPPLQCHGQPEGKALLNTQDRQKDTDRDKQTHAYAQRHVVE